MIKYFEDEELKIYSSYEPVIQVRAFCADDTKEVKQEKRKKPYLLKNELEFLIHDRNKIFTLLFKKNYAWDGASIPFLFRPVIGKKGSLEFLLPSMAHDKMCEEKHLINYDRKLSSLVFRALLISMGVNKLKANIMYHAVDNFQKLKSWKQAS